MDTNNNRIKKALATAKSIGYITDSDSIDSLMSMRFEILAFEFSDNEMDRLTANEIKTAFDEWLK